jgi:hypothetical protein
MTQLLPPADLYVATNAATLKALGATSVTATGGDTVQVAYRDIELRANASAVLADTVNGAKITFIVPGPTDGGQPIVDAKSAAAFLRQHPGVTEVVGYDGLDTRPLLVPGTVDGPTATAINAVLGAPGATQAPFIVVRARPADAVPTTPLDPELPKPYPVG